MQTREDKEKNPRKKNNDMNQHSIQPKRQQLDVRIHEKEYKRLMRE